MGTSVKLSRQSTGYILATAVAVLFLIVGLFTREWDNVLICIPVLAIVLYLLYGRRGDVYIPIALIVIMTVMMVMLQIARYLEQDGTLLEWIANLILGVFMSLIGLIVIYGMLRTSPGFDHERPFSVSFTAFCIAETMNMFIITASYVLNNISGGDSTEDMGEFISRYAAITLGALVTMVLFYANRHSGLFAHTLDRFMKENSADGSEEQQRRAIEDLISRGESSKLEFKSTLRTNLKTGEKDPRMEKAVLKTIVAFLNTKGGTLLIGVADDGTVTGIDESSFDGSRDKFSLHLNHLIENQIGKEFLPYITYYAVDFGGKGVMRVDCRPSDDPVFLIEKDESTFFIRSGPSSIDLHGMDLLYYANRNFGARLKRLKKPVRK